jgi:hypothetical protein
MPDTKRILAPLGGEDNIRMMCDASHFEYLTFTDTVLQVEFRVQKRICVVFYIGDPFRPLWSIGVLDEHKLHRSFSRGAIPEEELEEVFTLATGYSLSF